LEIRIKWIVVALLLVCIQGFAQRIQNFNVFAVNGSVGIKFTVSKGTQCNGYTIWHSLDSINFNVIYSYPGICGNTSADQDFSYTHTSPGVNVVNYYKIELPGVETSPVQRVYLTTTPQASLLMYPNPIVNEYDVLYLKIFNANNLRVVGFLYNQFGKPMRTLDITTKVDLANLYINDLENGLYVIWLTDGTQLFRGKFIINR
jgi:hypothetical protein